MLRLFAYPNENASTPLSDHADGSLSGAETTNNIRIRIKKIKKFTGFFLNSENPKILKILIQTKK
jgi:hypothetical protein